MEWKKTSSKSSASVPSCPYRGFLAMKETFSCFNFPAVLRSYAWSRPKRLSSELEPRLKHIIQFQCLTFYNKSRVTVLFVMCLKSDSLVYSIWQTVYLLIRVKLCVSYRVADPLSLHGSLAELSFWWIRILDHVILSSCTVCVERT